MIQIIDYGAGNLFSICNALKKLGQNCEVINYPKSINSNAKIIFPGVGAAGSAMKNLKKRGFDFKKTKNSFLGICLGMQLLFDYSEENNCKCLRVMEGTVKRFSNQLKVPQIGWNRVEKSKNNLLFKDIPNDTYFYFVNSYYVDTADSYVVAKTLYGENFASSVRKENFYGVQFHPEKSGEIGLKLLNNFCTLC